MKSKFSLFSNILLLMFLGIANTFAFYNPQTGRWLTRDAIQEEGGANLYIAFANSPECAFDPLGEDFIAVGDRWVHYTPGLFRHMSIEFFIEPCPSVTEGTRFSRGSEPGQRFDSFELQPLLKSYRHFLSDGTFVWTKVSEIRRSSTPKDFIVIYSDFQNSSYAAIRQWVSIVAAATTYEYGEQQSTRGTLFHWPNSKYKLFGNNSNTFIREMANVIGRNADVIGGNHPGNRFAMPVSYPGYTPIYSPWGNE